MDFGAVFVATCLAAAFGSAVMGLLANYPVALAPGMGQNAFFTYGVVIGLGHTWQSALGAVLVSGVIFVVLSILPVRQWLINAIPRNFKLGIAAGIGFFLGFIALKNAGIIVDNQATLVGLGDLTSVGALLCLGAFVLIVALTTKRITGAVVIGILLATLIGILIGDIPFLGVLSAPPSIAPVFFELDLVSVIDVSMLTVIMTMLLVDVFDTAGTLVGVSNRAGLLDEKGHLPRIEKALIADSHLQWLGRFSAPHQQLLMSKAPPVLKLGEEQVWCLSRYQSFSSLSFPCPFSKNNPLLRYRGRFALCCFCDGKRTSRFRLE